MQMLDFKMNERHPCSKPLCVGYNLEIKKAVDFDPVDPQAFRATRLPDKHYYRVGLEFMRTGLHLVLCPPTEDYIFYTVIKFQCIGKSENSF
jgi:hypothetical protein